MTTSTRALRTAILVGAALLGATPSHAQSDNVLLLLRSGSPPEDRVRIDRDGGIAAIAQLNVGAHPATGPGYRLMWIPSYAAFRAGSPGEAAPGDAWDAANVGYFSWAGGRNTVASGLASFAMGDSVSVTGSRGVGLGSNLTVSGYGGFAAGTGARCTGAYCVAVGRMANAAGYGATALGYRTTADADYSVALGARASTNGHAGAFVYGDASTTDSIEARINNEFAVRAVGGFRFRTNPSLTTGCDLGARSSSFNCTSSRTVKENFAEVDGEDLLDRIRAVPLTTWNLINEPDKPRHMGPVAEDFHAAFGLGSTDTSIGHQDIDGVNFGGVKALEARTRGLIDANGTLSAEVASLREELLETRRQTQELIRRIEQLEAAGSQ